VLYGITEGKSPSGRHDYRQRAGLGRAGAPRDSLGDHANG
ncbi:hypothetical protein A2U01_0068392, partial [Trifolium medium]|nr:hypothetical protein [Trifolium medium]